MQYCNCMFMYRISQTFVPFPSSWQSLRRNVKNKNHLISCNMQALSLYWIFVPFFTLCCFMSSSSSAGELANELNSHMISNQALVLLLPTSSWIFHAKSFPFIIKIYVASPSTPLYGRWWPGRAAEKSTNIL